MRPCSEARHDQILHQLTAIRGQLSALDTHRKEVSTLKLTLKKQNQDYKDLWCKYKALEKKLQLLHDTRPAAHACCADHAGSAHAQAMAKQLAHAQPLRADSLPPAHQHALMHTSAAEQHLSNLSTKSHSLPTTATVQRTAPAAAAKTVVHNSFGGRWLGGDLHGAVLQATVSPVRMAGPGRTLSACAVPMRTRSSSNCRTPSKTVIVQTGSPLRTVDSAPAATGPAPAPAPTPAVHEATGLQYARIHAGACHAGKGCAGGVDPSTPCKSTAKQVGPPACLTHCSNGFCSLCHGTPVTIEVLRSMHLCCRAFQWFHSIQLAPDVRPQWLVLL